MVDADDYLYFCDRALDGMATIVAGLGDDLANRRPSLPGASSPYALLTHCLGVVQYWAGHLVAGRDLDRDRDAEFVASGPVAGLLSRAEAVKRMFHGDTLAADPQG